VSRLEGYPGGCQHPEGLRAAAGSLYRCPACEAQLDLSGVERWTREAERLRDEAFSSDTEGLSLEERQAEVYRRRRAMYEVLNVPGSPYAGDILPEMVLVVYDAAGDSYECRIFYKAPRPAWGTESFSVGATDGEIESLLSDENPTVRLASEKIAEFHAARETMITAGVPAPPRRVFYAGEL
jgi:hypothetical protein